MKNLPAELLSQIFLLLHQVDKVKCMTVCRQWNNIIQRACLFDTVYIGSKEQLAKLNEKIQQSPSQALKVERLALTVEYPDFLSREDITKLVSLFPNLRVYFRCSSDCDDDTVEDQILPLLFWNNIEYIADHSVSCVTTQHILASRICPRLTKISINGGEDDDGSHFISLLINSPALENLIINGFYFQLEDLELLHENAPSLASLSFNNSTINCDKKFPVIKKSARSITKLELNSVGIVISSEEIPLFQYIGQKYINISELLFQVYVLLINNYDLVKDYYAGFISLMGKIGLQLEILSLSVEVPLIDSIHTLDHIGCRIKTLRLFSLENYSYIEQIVRSDQMNYIQALTIDWCLEGHSLSWMKQFKKLKELDMTFSYRQEGIANLTELLNMIGDGLEALKLHYNYLIFDPSTTCQYPSLKTLSVRFSPIPLELDCFVSQSFPRLRKLEFYGCLWLSRQFSLPVIDLFYLEIYGKLSSDNNDKNILITTLKNNERQWYTDQNSSSFYIVKNVFGSGDASLLPSITTLPFTKFKRQFYFEFTCNSVQTVFFNNCID